MAMNDEMFEMNETPIVDTPAESATESAAPVDEDITALEEESADSGTEDDEETDAPAPQPQAQAQPASIESSRQNLGNEIGTYFTGSMETAMPFEERARELDALRAAMRNKTVCQARVQRINAPDKDGNVTIDALYGNSTWVRFIAQDFFAETPRFARIADDENPESRGSRWRQAGSHYANANINFIVMSIERGRDGTTMVYGSRSLAMRAIRESTFFGKRCNVKSGDYGKAEIVDCRPNRIWVEFCGVEVRMNNAALVAFQYLPDATKDPRFEVGNSIYVAISRIEVNKEAKTVDLALSHALIEMTSTDIPDLTDDIIGSSNFGYIVAVHPNSYTAVFMGQRCRAIIAKDANRSYVPLNIGDKVLVRVTRIISKSTHMVRGLCRKV